MQGRENRLVTPKTRQARKVSVLGLGGTIVMTGSGRGVAVSKGEFKRMLANVERPHDVALSYEQFAALPSCDLRFCDLRRLATRTERLISDGLSGIVITQGTDTMEETAFALDLLIHSPVPIVITGAMRNPSLAGADGPSNLNDAVTAASAPELAELGVLVAMNNELHPARFVRKSHTSNVAAFQSSNMGPIGLVSEGRVHKFGSLPRLARIALNGRVQVPRVGLHTVTLDDDAHLLTWASGAGYDGLVVEGFGAGHVPASMVDELGRLADRMPVVLTSRAGEGVVFKETYAFPGSEIDLIGRGLISAGWLDGRKARVALSLLLASQAGRGEITTFFQSCGG